MKGRKRRLEAAPFLPAAGAGDPLEHLEARRLAYIEHIEREVARASAAGDIANSIRGAVQLIRLTSLNRVRVDVTAPAMGLDRQPDLSRLSAQQLAQIEAHPEIAAAALEAEAKKLDE